MSIDQNIQKLYLSILFVVFGFRGSVIVSLSKASPNADEKAKKVTAKKVGIGPPKLTRFERARIIGARALQLALGAPPFIPIPSNITDPISLAIAELESKALPISIRRALPDGRYQDIPIDYLLN
ncbi:MAG: DNA-directed RNA polymerase subunit K [archaeon]|nr:DNA-directed RNA polymerase subunit K [archaeon]